MIWCLFCYHQVALVQVYPEVKVVKSKLPEPFSEIRYIGKYNNLFSFLATSPTIRRQQVVYFDDNWDVTQDS